MDAAGQPASQPSLRVNEVFHSIQGESTWSGCRCTFVRLAGCHLRCHYCDTEYAFAEGRRVSVQDILDQVKSFRCGLVQITGGEPLLQQPVHELTRRLCDAGHTVLIETSGACDISQCDPRAIRIMDIKTPGSGEVARNVVSNFDHLTDRDEVKFVITARADYEWARQFMREYRLAERVHAVLMSPVFEQAAGREVAGQTALDPTALAEWILEDALPVRMQLQMHKFIWSPQARGV